MLKWGKIDISIFFYQLLIIIMIYKSNSVRPYYLLCETNIVRERKSSHSFDSQSFLLRNLHKIVLFFDLF